MADKVLKFFLGFVLTLMFLGAFLFAIAAIVVAGNMIFHGPVLCITILKVILGVFLSYSSFVGAGKLHDYIDHI